MSVRARLKCGCSKPSLGLQCIYLLDFTQFRMRNQQEHCRGPLRPNDPSWYQALPDENEDTEAGLWPRRGSRSEGRMQDLVDGVSQALRL